ncbi:MAG: hypothetical protein HYZ48_00365 [Chlamydiales bacterium]|nr:hypothetical protein [Chlamydiales bacterium]
MTNQDKRIAREIQRQGKGCIILFNKWDLVSGCRMEHCLKSMRIDLPFLAHCPTLFVSALQGGRHLDQIFAQVLDVYEQSNRRITTGQLNKFIEQAVQRYHPPMLDGKRLRIFYMAQVDVCPPRFVMFVNNPKLMVDTYAKYILNQFRETYQFTGAVIQIFLKGRKVKSEKKAPETAKPYDEEPSFELLPVDDPLLFEEALEEETASHLDPSYF